MQRLVPSSLRGMARRGVPVDQARLHLAVLAGGLLITVVGLAGWARQGGPASPAELLLVLDLTLGGTILATGALVGRARGSDARRARQLEVLRLAARRMSASLTREEIGRAVVEETQRVIDYHNARVYLLEPPDMLVPVAFEGRVGAYEKVDLDILRTRLGEGLTGWVGLNRQPLRVDDATRDPRGATIPGTDDVDESMLVVPMLHDGELLGVVTLSKLGLRQFDDDDLRLLAILADQAATAFANAGHLAETRRLADELRQLLAMSSALSRSLDPRDVANLMAQHLARAAGADEAQISDWDRVNDRLRTLGSFPAERLDTYAPYYPLGSYPLTRRVLTDAIIADVDAEDPEADPAEVALMRAAGMRGLLMLPLVAKGEAIGLVELSSHGRPISGSGKVTLLRTMAHEAAMALDNARLYETARDLADRDPLTGFFNHRYLQQRLGEEVLRAVRTRRPVSVLMLDLDDFKLVNDTFGHLYGDGVLAHVAELVRSVIRASDVAARYGGDEFALILPETDRDAAEVLANRLLEAFRATTFAGDGHAPVPVGASIGIAAYPADGRSPTELLSVADASLYAAKASGNGGLAARLTPPTSVPATRPRAGARRHHPDVGAPVGSGGV